jgi:REP element-mobilizing transposase RayT
MARSLRIERANGVYHIINRGNYRHDLFINDGAHEAFERCLFEACEKCGWILEGHCVMTNHFHLVVRTPRGNLSYGMKWLQATFANRYHRFRKVHGKLFQGRFKSLVVEEDAYLGAPQSVSMLTSRFRQQKQNRDVAYLEFTQNITKGWTAL